MSDSQAYEEVTVASDGVTVVKRFEEDEFPVPAIAFEVTSERDESVTVRLRDIVPESVAVEDLGFHPEYGSEYWTIDDDKITFEKEIGANAEYTTVYGIRATGAEDVEQFLTEPTIEEVDPPLPTEGDDEGVVPESDDDVVKEAIAGEGEIPGLEEEGGEDFEEEDVETLDLKDPNQAGGASRPAPEPADSADSEDDEASDADEVAETEQSTNEPDDEAETESEPTEPADVSVEGSLVGALAEELRQNNVSAEDVKLLRRALELAGQEGGSVDARLEKVQSDIADLRAYTDALERFLDENGTGEQLIEDFQGKLDEFESRLDEVQGRVSDARQAAADASNEVDAVRSDIDAVTGEVEQIAGEVDAVGSEVDEMGETLSDVENEVWDVSEDVEAVEHEVRDVSEDVEEMEEDIDEMGDDVEEVTDEMAELSGDVERVSTDMSEFESSVSDLEGQVEGLRSELDEVREKVTEEDVVDRLDDIESDIQDLRDWQEQIKQTFGG